MTAKICTKCGEEKSIEDFYAHKINKDGRRYECKVCSRKICKTWRESVEGRKVKRAYEQTSKYKESKQKYNQLPSRREYKKLYYLSPEGKASSARAAHMRRIRAENTCCNLTAKEWEEIKASQDYKCAICGEVKLLHRDHIIPVIKGGGLTKSNIHGLCKNCNARKFTALL